MTRSTKPQTKPGPLVFKPYSLLLLATLAVGLIVGCFNNPGWGVGIINLGVAVHLLRRGVLALERIAATRSQPQAEDLGFEVRPPSARL